METVDPDETKLYEVRKHNFGVAVIWVQIFLGMIVVVFLSFMLMPSFIADTDKALLYATLSSIPVILISFLLIALITSIYRQNRLIVTDRNITQVLQYGLFSRKVSQLNIVNIEDVTSIQNGAIATMMNYGTLKIETAGEQTNFSFTFCPNPNHCAKVILDAREKMLGQTTDKLPASMTRQERRRAQSRAKRLKNDIKPDKDTIKKVGEEIVEQAQK